MTEDYAAKPIDGCEESGSSGPGGSGGDGQSEHPPEAREIKVQMSATRFIEVNDPDYFGHNPNTELPVDGRHFQWDLTAYAEKKLKLTPLLKQSADVSVNQPNHIYCGSRELIVLDVGVWGAYKRWTELESASDEEINPQREFGFIEAGHVWLCQFRSDGPVDGTVDRLREAGCVKAAALVELLEVTIADCALGVELKRYAAIADPGGVEKMAWEKLYIIFPDLHLPEKWPDAPLEVERFKNPSAEKTAEVREALQWIMRWCQNYSLKLRSEWKAFGQPPFNWYFPGDVRTVSVAVGSEVSETTNRYDAPLGGINDDSATVRENLQWILDNIESGEFHRDYPVLTLRDEGDSSTEYPITAAQLLAEKRLVDRRLRADSTWFYAGARDAAQSENPSADPQPAIDLANFLCAIEKLRAQEGSKVQVVQVGDMYELWLDREFIYQHFPVVDDEAASAKKALLVLAGAAASAGFESFQYRHDRGWRDPLDANDKSAKRYVHHTWPLDEMLKRHQVGAHTQKSEVDALPRLRRILRARLDNSTIFVCPFHKRTRAYRGSSPSCRRANGTNTSGNTGGQRVLHDTIATVMRRPTGIGWSSTCWHGSKYWGLYGNHDGYRGDPLLGVSSRHGCRAGWISEPGIWFEHGHRWDDYNRDGMAFGAAVTNYVHYYRQELTEGIVDAIKSYMVPQRQTSFFTGAALWFLLANEKSKQLAQNGHLKEIALLKNEMDEIVHKFGVYVMGHTHNGDLARLKFEYEPDDEDE